MVVISPVRPRESGDLVFHYNFWIPACAGMNGWELLFWIPACAGMSGWELPFWIPAEAGMKGAYPFNAFSCATVAARSVVWSLPAMMKR
jgi:hypothetical protein